MLADEGQRVEKNAVLVRLDDAIALIDEAKERAAVEAAKAIVSEREADAALAARERERIEGMASRGSANVSEVDEKKTRESTTIARAIEAKANLALANATLARATQKRERMTIRAPFTGRIVKKRTEVGQWADSGTEVLDLIALDEVEVRLSVPETLIGNISSGDGDIRVRVSALGLDVIGKLLAIVPDADPLSRAFPVRVIVKNEGERLRPGMSVTGLLPSGVKELVLTLPKDAVLRDDAGEYVFMNAGGSAVPARVKTLFAVGDHVAVRSASLTAGAKVVVGGNERLFPGMPITDVDAPPAPPAAPSAPAAKPASDKPS
jgi:RND family efflux transporter MFP subunit